MGITVKEEKNQEIIGKMVPILLLLHLHRLMHKVWSGNNSPGGKESRRLGQHLKDRPSRFHFIGDFIHGCHQNRTLEPLWICEVDEEADDVAHGLAVEERREVGFAFNKIEERKSVSDDEIDGRDKSPEVAGSAMALEVESKAGKALLSEEDGGGLEGLADVVAIAVDHEDETPWRRTRGGKGKP